MPLGELSLFRMDKLPVQDLAKMPIPTAGNLRMHLQLGFCLATNRGFAFFSAMTSVVALFYFRFIIRVLSPGIGIYKMEILRPLQRLWSALPPM